MKRTALINYLTAQLVTDQMTLRRAYELADENGYTKDMLNRRVVSRLGGEMPTFQREEEKMAINRYARKHNMFPRTVRDMTSLYRDAVKEWVIEVLGYDRAAVVARWGEFGR